MDKVKGMLSKKLEGNDIHLVKVIIDYAYGYCFICLRQQLDTNIVRAYCDCKEYKDFYMEDM